ncbi:hypothetical protein [Chitinimonas koreensis]|uniref:hypothetical protein n=1 Tax=Chitinimonas koreensis TaxID=356302 RepID=UPI0004186B17|nr:hypothetical protein [Chitinimonas koreensis]QNM94870.1 hypothetical protein H9L41_13130 [Chitinimonas koreensis]
MILIPALALPLLREIESLFDRSPRPSDDLPAEFRQEAHGDGLSLTASYAPAQGAPVYVQAEYR